MPGCAALLHLDHATRRCLPAPTPFGCQTSLTPPSPGDGDTINMHAFGFEQLARLKYGHIAVQYRQVRASPVVARGGSGGLAHNVGSAGRMQAPADPLGAAWLYGVWIANGAGPAAPNDLPMHRQGAAC